MDFSQTIKNIETGADVDLSVFKEPRGVIRVLQFVISILAALAIYGYEGILTIFYCSTSVAAYHYSYPFKLSEISQTFTCGDKSIQRELAVNDMFSHYAEYFLFISIVSILYSFITIIVYMKFTTMYETNDKYPVADFTGTVILAVLWLFGSAAWSHSLTALKDATNQDFLFNSLRKELSVEKVVNSGYFGLNVSAIMGCLSFFLWASDLWFLYKETPWFQRRQAPSIGSPA